MGNKVPLYINIEDIPKAEENLQKYGFYHFALQEQKEDQKYGLVREATYGDWMIQGYFPKEASEMSPCQIHVRIFNDGKIESEIEISRFDARHIYSPRVSHHLLIELILALSGIHYRRGNPSGPLDPVRELENFPKEERIEWLPLVLKAIEAMFADNQANE